MGLRIVGRSKAAFAINNNFVSGACVTGLHE
jgi:hypothetical protein